MNPIYIVREIESANKEERFGKIVNILGELELDFFIQEYDTGRNIVIPSSTGEKQKNIGLSSHYDVVPGSPGANDNASSVAVCIYVMNKLKQSNLRTFGVTALIFDEEETGLKGSKAYIDKFGITNLFGLMNLEMTGSGDRFILWPVNEQSHEPLMEAFENNANRLGIQVNKYDMVVTHSGDHRSFIEAGLTNVFTLTCASKEDLLVAKLYYTAVKRGFKGQALLDILKRAPLFRHYHQPTDTSEFVSEKSLLLAANTILETVESFDEDFKSFTKVK